MLDKDCMHNKIALYICKKAEILKIYAKAIYGAMKNVIQTSSWTSGRVMFNRLSAGDIMASKWLPWGSSTCFLFI